MPDTRNSLSDAWFFSPRCQLQFIGYSTEGYAFQVSAEEDAGPEEERSAELVIKDPHLQPVPGALLAGAQLFLPTEHARVLALVFYLGEQSHTQGPGKRPIPLAPSDLALLKNLARTLEKAADDYEPTQLVALQIDNPPWSNASNSPVLRIELVESSRSYHPDADHLVIPSPGHYAALQRALATNAFSRVEGSRFPRAALDRGGSHGYAELRPVSPEQELLMSPDEADALADRMWQQREELSDKDADTLDAISAAWIGQAKKAGDRVGIYLDDLLRWRGLKPKKGGHGRRGGFEASQRADLWRCLLHLQEIWLDIAEASVVEHDTSGRRRRRKRTLQSRAFVMTDRIGQHRLDGTMDIEAILVTPGEAFGRFLLGPGRQVALLSSEAIRYDPLRQRYEKRLARFLSWQWRVGAHKGDFLRTYRISTLVDEIELTVHSNRPGNTRNRLETALDRLEEDRVIAGWQYQEGWSDDDLPRQGWLPLWLEARVIVEAPDIIKDHYKRLDQIDARPVKAIAAGPVPEDLDWSQVLKDVRKRRRCTQLQAAEEIGISRTYVAQIERGRSPSRAAKDKIRAWLSP